MLNSWGQIKAHRQLVAYDRRTFNNHCSFNFLSFLFFSLLNFSCSLSFHFLSLFLTLPYLTFSFPLPSLSFLLLLSFLADPSLTSFPSLPFPPPLHFFPSPPGLVCGEVCVVLWLVETSVEAPLAERPLAPVCGWLHFPHPVLRWLL